MKTKKFRLLKIVAIICFIFAIIQVGIGLLIIFFPLTDNSINELINNNNDTSEEFEIEKSIEELELPEDISIEDKMEAKQIIIDVIKAIIAVIYFIEAVFSVIEGLLIYRAIKKGKTTLIIIFLLMGFVIPLLTLINAAINSTYDINSATNVVSLIIKTIILKQIFEIRRMNSD